MKSEKAKARAMALAICTVFLVAVSGVFVVASTSEDVSSVLANPDYILSVEVKDESPLLYVSSEGVLEDTFLIYEYAQDESHLDYIASGVGLNETPLDAIEFGETTGCEIKYDDGDPDGAVAWYKVGLCSAVHFTNTCSGTTLKTAKFYIYQDPAEIEWEVLDWTGSEPGSSLIASGTTKPKRPGWHEVNVGVTVPTDFVIVSYQTEADKPYIGADSNSPIDNRSWYYSYYSGKWCKLNDLSSDVPLDVMIRAEMEVGDPILRTDPKPPAHDFGSMPVNETRTWMFVITNIGSGTLKWEVRKDQDWIGVSPISGTTMTETDHVAVKVDTYKMTPGETYIGNIIVDSSNGGTETGTIRVFIPTGPEVSISTDKFNYCPGDTMRISVNITNPTGGDLIFERYGLILEMEGDVPQFKLWIPTDNRTISGDKAMEEDVSVDDESSEPFDIILYARLVDPGTGLVLAADSTCCVCCPT